MRPSVGFDWFLPSDFVLRADHVQITALSRALRVNISVAYLDGREPSHSSTNPDAPNSSNTTKVEFVEFRNNDASAVDPIILLYRCVVVLFCLSLPFSLDFRFL